MEPSNLPEKQKIWNLPIWAGDYFLPAFLAQASLQYFDLASKVVYGFLQNPHFFSIHNPAT
jgi:hypothetical protein